LFKIITFNLGNKQRLRNTSNIERFIKL